MNIAEKNVTNKILPLLAGVFTLLALSLYKIFLNDVWIDEASTLETVGLPLNEVWNRALVWEAQAPLYYFIQAVWMQLNFSLVFGRFLPLLFTIGSLILLNKIILLFDSSTLKRTLLIVLVASTFYTIFAATTIRYFGLTLLLSSWLFYLFLKFYTEKDAVPVKIRAIFITLATVSVLTQYYLGFLLFSFGITLLLLKGLKPFLQFVIDMLLPIAALVLIASSIMMQVETYSETSNTYPSIRAIIEFVIIHIENTVIACNWIQHFTIGRYIVRILYLVIIILAFLNRKKLSEKTKYLILTISFSMLCLVAVFYILQDDIINFWHILFVFINVLILLFAAMSVLQTRIVVLLTSVIIFLNIGSLVYFQKPDNQISRIVTFLEKREVKNQNLLIYPNLYADMFKHHYKGDGNLIQFPVTIDYNNGFTIEEWAIKNNHQLDSYFNTNQQKADFLLIEERISNLMNVDFKYEIIDLYVKNNFNTTLDTAIGHYRIRELNTNKPSHYE